MHRKAYARSRARGRMYMHNVHVCMYACTRMRFTLHSELRAYLSYGHPPRRRCPGKGGLSVHQSKKLKVRPQSEFSGFFRAAIEHANNLTQYTPQHTDHSRTKPLQDTTHFARTQLTATMHISTRCWVHFASAVRAA